MGRNRNREGWEEIIRNLLTMIHIKLIWLIITNKIVKCIYKEIVVLKFTKLYSKHNNLK